MAQQIWSDEDVHQIFDIVNGGPSLRMSALEGNDLLLMIEFLGHDQELNEFSTAPMVRDAVIAGIQAVEGFREVMPGTNSRGWKKFVICMTGHNTMNLWENFKHPEAAEFGAWMGEALERVGARPDGWTTALGSMCTAMMGIPGATTRTGPDGRFFVPNGDVARRIAGIVPTMSAAANEAAWRPDPTSRHQLRYFDGTSWTHHVANGGVQAIDSM